MTAPAYSATTGDCHELRFASLSHAGRAVAVPCDERGNVDLDGMPERMRLTYFGARALIGREYSYPTVELVH